MVSFQATIDDWRYVAPPKEVLFRVPGMVSGGNGVLAACGGKVEGWVCVSVCCQLRLRTNTG